MDSNTPEIIRAVTHLAVCIGALVLLAIGDVHTGGGEVLCILLATASGSNSATTAVKVKQHKSCDK